MRAVKTILLFSILFLAVTIIAKDIEDRKELPEEIRFAKRQTLVQPTLYHLPPYPTRAYNDGVDCEVWVKVKLSKEGKVDSAVVLYCEKEDYGFEEAALGMAKNSKYTPKLIWKKYRKKWLFSQLLFTAKKIGWQSAEFYEMHFPQQGDEFIEGDLMPELIHKSKPTYPKRAREYFVDGTVFMKIKISRNGVPSMAIISETTDIKWKYGFNEIALQSAGKCRFTPLIRHGDSLETVVNFPYEFILHSK